MTTDPSTLPQHKGKPVPWVTRWTDEVSKQRFSFSTVVQRGGSLLLTYGDNKDFRDKHGVLWQIEGTTRAGVPDWAAVSTYRQRASMNFRRCQMCGQKIDDRPIVWLMPIDGLEYVDERTVLTQQPPTCAECVPLALELCPNLKREGWLLLKVLDYTQWGVQGRVVTDHEGKLVQVQATVPYDTSLVGPTFSLGQVMAQQQVVQLGRFVVTETHDPRGRLDATAQEAIESMNAIDSIRATSG